MRKRDTLRRIIKRLSATEISLKRAGKGAAAYKYKVRTNLLKALLNH